MRLFPDTKLRLLVCSKKADRLYLCRGYCGTPGCEKNLVRHIEFDDYWNAIQQLKDSGYGRVEDYLYSVEESFEGEKT